MTTLWTYTPGSGGRPFDYVNHSIITTDDEVNQRILADCIDGAPLETPTYKNRLSGGLKALIEGVGLSVLRPFAALGGLFISSDLDPKKHPLLVKMGRYLEAPRLYSILAFQRLGGYAQGGANGKAKVILSQQLGAFLWVKISAKHTSNYRAFIQNLNDSNGKRLTDDGYEEHRLLNLRLCKADDIKSGRTELLFKDLIEAGFLVNKRK